MIIQLTQDEAKQLDNIIDNQIEDLIFERKEKEKQIPTIRVGNKDKKMGWLELTNEEKAERVEVSIEDTEREIKSIELIITEVKKIKENSCLNSKRTIEGFITQLNKDKEFCEQELDDLNQSLVFIRGF